MNNYNIINVDASHVDVVDNSKKLKVVSDQFDALLKCKKVAVKPYFTREQQIAEPITVSKAPEIVGRPVFKEPDFSKFEREAEAVYSEKKPSAYDAPVYEDKYSIKEEVSDSVYDRPHYEPRVASTPVKPREEVYRAPRSYTSPSIRSDANVGDKANKIRNMKSKTMEGTNVYKVLDVAVNTLDTLDAKIEKLKEKIEEFKISVQKNDAAKNFELKNLKALEASFGYFEDVTFSGIRYASTGNDTSEENYMERANDILEVMHEKKSDFREIIAYAQSLVDTYDNKKNEDLDQIEELKKSIEEINSKKAEICKKTEDKLNVALEADKEAEAQIKLEANNREKEKQASDKARRLQDTVAFGLDEISKIAGSVNIPIVDEEVEVTPAMDAFKRIDKNNRNASDYDSDESGSLYNLFGGRKAA